METEAFITSVSLVTAFAGGMVALFAPCCITFLLPSYLANIFRHKRRVVAMTFLFALGIATILVPTALGIRAVADIFQRFHTETYLVGGAFMILLGIMQITGKKITIPMLNLTIDLNAHKSPWAVYVLGVFSGITSSCCTPVLVGILTLSFLSPTFLSAAMAAVAYVAGMVVPLVVMALFLEKIQWDRIPLVRTKTITVLNKPVLLTDAIAGILFLIVGVVFILLAASGRIVMGEMIPVEKTLGQGLINLVRVVRTLPGAEIAAAFVVVTIIGWLTYRFIKERKKL